MELSRREYPAMLDALQPAQAVTLLNDRLKHVGRVNNEIADWLQERKRIEELYASSLRKLAQREPPDSSSELGIFTTSWQKVVNSTASFAESHHALAQKIEADIEKPLRAFATSNRELQNIPNMQSNLQSLARDYDSAQKKSDKSKGRSTASKSTAVSSEMDKASSQWRSQAPYVFEALQAIDESRCNHLRDLLTQFQTHELDMVDKSRKFAENTLDSILNIETSNEIQTFVSRNIDGVAADTRRPSERRMSRSQTNALQPVTTASSGPEELATQRSFPVQDEKKSRLGGLKRLGTVMRRKSTQPTAYGQRPPTGEQSSSNLGPVATTSADDPRENRGIEPPSLQDWQLPNSSLAARPSAPATEPAIAVRDQSFTREIQTSPLATNGTSHVSDLEQLRDPFVQSTIASEPVAPPAAPQEIAREPERSAEPPMANDPISLAEQEAASVSDPTASAFKVDIRNAPITEDTSARDSAMVDMANTLRAQAAPLRRSGTNRGRRDGRNSTYTQSFALDSVASEQESPSLNAQAPVPMAATADSTSALLTAPISTAISGSSAIIPSSALLESPTSFHPGSSPPPPVKRSTLSEDRTGSDTQSITSSRSAGIAALALRHPAMQESGLNSSIIETVSAWLENGGVTRAVVVGEIALAYNLSPTTETPTNGTLRLDNFTSLEKVAPNPAFITAADATASGEYSVNIGSLAGAGGNPMTAFKYQVHIGSDQIQTQAPIVLTPSWRVEEKQISVILSYALNPLYSAPLTLSNVTLIIYLEMNEQGTGQAVICQSKPAGTFSKERNLVYWKLDELSLVPGAAAQKIVARFATEGQAKPGRVEAKWEISSPPIGAAVPGSSISISQPNNAAPSSSDPFADEDSSTRWKTLASARKLVSGTYTAV